MPNRLLVALLPFARRRYWSSWAPFGYPSSLFDKAHSRANQHQHHHLIQFMSSENLREEGKEYFRQKNYAHARAKFTDALEVDGESIIQYANRSACYYYLRQCVLVHLYCMVII
ncbi:uncharacterized protein BT62DRAFT_478330 [Guyanagaster necrorhizus]|uniref:Uncharacterized protein n=1 Tax=Guyanagaster necrorhizus TaxID=856835 RepID=A0A9P7VI28_9AGAR|nr:uncharacterized protein BT62DRAFT_478330 [Guyanagaster necrorhizus MCA 3950]KAG7441448.1 hypothetical protein BT62DRAFT_478330 [Guyanagaster necrorhizus MCA 3950]